MDGEAQFSPIAKILIQREELMAMNIAVRCFEDDIEMPRPAILDNLPEGVREGRAEVLCRLLRSREDVPEFKFRWDTFRRQGDVVKAWGVGGTRWTLKLGDGGGWSWDRDRLAAHPVDQELEKAIAEACQLVSAEACQLVSAEA